MSQPCEDKRLHTDRSRCFVKILTRYVLREHLGPLIFALTALTSLLMLQFVARQLGNLVGKGLPWRVIAEFFVLSLPFTVAMTLPMAVLVATLHAFGRMATEHEVTAFKASGVRVTTLMFPVVIGAAVLALLMIGFNDQVLPRANHRLRVLQQDMARTKPTFALTEQTLNQVTNGFYMRVSRLDRASNKMKEVTIYDLSMPFDRKTIYADSGDLSFTPDKKDLQLVLFDGYQQQLEGNTKHTLRRSYFRSQAVRVKAVGGGFEQTGGDEWRGDREKSICEMQSEYVVNAGEYERVRQIYIETMRKNVKKGQKTMVVPRPRPPTEGLARIYCNGLALVFRTQTAIPSSSLPSAHQVAVTPGSPVPPSAGVSPTPQAVQPVPGSVTDTTTLSPSMKAALDAEKALIARSQQQAVDSGPIKVALAIRAKAEAEQKAYNSRNGVAPSDSAKNAQAVVAGSNPDSTAPKSVASGGAAPPLPTSAQPPAAVPPTTVSPAVVPPTVPPATAAQTAVPPATNPATTAVAPPGAVPPAVVPVTTPGNVPAGTSATTVVPPAVPTPAVAAPAPGAAGTIQPDAAPGVDPTLVGMITDGGEAGLAAANSQLGLVRASMDSLAVEIQKKFALSFACIVFVLFGPPIALRFPRGGVGATLGVSLIVFGAYYVCLMAGETLADAGKLPPFIAMWMANLIFTVAGLLLLLRIEKTADASRGGGIRAWFEERRARRSRRAIRVQQQTVSA